MANAGALRVFQGTACSVLECGDINNAVRMLLNPHSQGAEFAACVSRHCETLLFSKGLSISTTVNCSSQLSLLNNFAIKPHNTSALKLTLQQTN